MLERQMGTRALIAGIGGGTGGTRPESDQVSPEVRAERWDWSPVSQQILLDLPPSPPHSDLPCYKECTVYRH